MTQPETVTLEGTIIKVQPYVMSHPYMDGAATRQLYFVVLQDSYTLKPHVFIDTMAHAILERPASITAKPISSNYTLNDLLKELGRSGCEYNGIPIEAEGLIVKGGIKYRDSADQVER